tara:strand:+ start:3149 stop:6577 length:3429 start_codon:yes stop_codon:yes gene_type:complete
MQREIQEREQLMNDNNYDYLYPNLNDPNFNVKIYQKKEFNDTEFNGTIENVIEEGDKLCNAKFELANHQIFVRNFLSNQTPYNGLLLYHGLGTGKTCSAITISEEYREYMKQVGITKRIIIVGNKNIQDNYKLQLFDERNLELTNGIWTMTGCTGNKILNEINPMNMKGISKNKIISQANNIINLSYLFLGYREFGNLIAKKINKYKNESDTKLKEKNIIKAIQTEYNNRLIIIDEVQNIRMTDNIEDKKVGQRLLELTKHAINVKLLLLSATPMFNNYKEIVWLINLLNQNDKRHLIKIADVFDSKGNFKTDDNGNEIGKELLLRKARGYVSFVRGDNPYTFPYRIYPTNFLPSNSILKKTYPKKQINGKTLIQGIEYIDVYVTDIGDNQKLIYDKISNDIQSKYLNLTEEKLDKGIGYQILEAPLQILNMTYPVDIDDIKEAYGKSGLENAMKFSSKRNDFKYKPGFEDIFKNENIGKYSGKIKTICDNIMISEGIVLIYSQYIDGGIIPIALALEELGFTRFGQDNLFETPPVEQIDSLTLKIKSNVDKNKFKPAKYSIISGDITLSPNNIKEIKKLTSDTNKNGEDIKVVIISKAGSEGIDLKNIRQIHIIDPWYNMNRIEQIIGRGVRTCSHKSLEFSKRNVMIFLYATYMGEDVETLDLYLYRLAEIKAIKIGIVSRALKKNAIDCILNRAQYNYNSENMKQTVKLNLSNKLEIDWLVGDKPFTALCDYMDKCTFDCEPNKIDLDINYDTYNEDFILLNTEKIIEKVKDLFKEKYVYEKNDLFMLINDIRNYPSVQIYTALNKMIEDKTYIITDMVGKKGFLINIGDYYLFQPIELIDEHISIFERITPIDYKHQKINILLPNTINNTLDYTNVKNKDAVTKNTIISDLQNKFTLATSNNIIKRGSKDWYLLCSKTIELMEKNGIKKNILEILLIDHIMEEIKFDDKLFILQYITDKKTTNKFEKLIANYFDKHIIKNNGITGIVFNNDPSTQRDGLAVLVFDKDSSKWIKAKYQDIKDLSSKMKETLEIPSERFAHIIGFISQFKKENLVFKVLDTKAKRHAGARCDQAGKTGVLNVLNKIHEENIYTKENTNTYNVTQMCSEQELYLRYFNSIRKNDKYWFLTPEQSIMSRIEK